MRVSCVLMAGCCVTMLRATTLEQLSFNEMILKSTSIVHAKVTGSYGAFRGVDVYTFYQLQVSETLKPLGGQNTARIEVAVPGGTARGVRQAVAGAPTLTIGGDYVLFLWNGSNTLTQIIGLSQGMFQMTQDASGSAIIIRPGSSEAMLDKGGVATSDQTLTVRWSDARAQIRKTLGGAN